MGEVITVDFKRKARLTPNPIFERFIDMLYKFELCEDDIEEVVEAIHSIEVYEKAEPDIRRIVDIWHENTEHLT
jgi:hypothetical protein